MTTPRQWFRARDLQWQELMALMPSSPAFLRLRAAYYREVLADCGPGLEVSQNVILKFPERLTLGADVFFNRGAFLAAHAPITIGDRASIGPFVIINSGDHRYADRSRPIREQGHNRQPIKIEDDVWIGAHAVILKGTVLGEGCVVAAGAVVTKNVRPFGVVAGVPAQLIKERPTDQPAHALSTGPAQASSTRPAQVLSTELDNLAPDPSRPLTHQPD
jgi:acetyltransferase-like isoleucine patch superfamily enzyme